MGEPQTGERKIGILKKKIGKLFGFFWKLCLAVFGPFSASPGARAKPGRSHDPWLRPGFAPAPGEAEKGPKTAKNDFQKIGKFPKFPENCWPHSGLAPHFRGAEI